MLIRTGTTQQTQMGMHNSCNTNFHFCDPRTRITIRIQILYICWWHNTPSLIRYKNIQFTNTMLNCQMFGLKKLATQHLTSWNKPPKVHVSKWVENSHVKNAPHYELTTTKSSWFCLHMGENWIPKIEWQIIPQLPNKPLASKTFSLQNFYNLTCI
jgi:hypothetical protein